MADGTRPGSEGAGAPRIAAAVALLALVAASAAAHAEPSAGPPGSAPPADAPTEQVVTTRYGWQIAAVDVAVVAAAAGLGENGGVQVGIAGLLLGGPIVHLAHGHSGRALGSLGLRAGVPVAGTFAFALACNASDDDPSGETLHCLGPAAAGFLLGLAVVETVDLISARDVESSALPVAPTLTVGGGAAQLGLAGRF